MSYKITRVVATLLCLTFSLSPTANAQSTSESKPAPDSKASGTKGITPKDEDAKEESIEAKVIKIIDGDSIKVQDKDGKEYEVQIEGTDAPEAKQPFGSESTDTMSQWVKDKAVKVSWNKKDNFDRLLAQVYVEGKHVNTEMIRAGMAWHFKRYNKSKELAAVEDEARKEKRGLWAQDKPVAPWDYRKENRAPDKPDR
jgi:endonuclease YncB( thermonuclease family)